LTISNITGSFIETPSNTINEVLIAVDKLSGLLTLIGVTIAILVFFYERRRERKRHEEELDEHLSRVCTAVLGEIEELKRLFKIKKSDDVEKITSYYKPYAFESLVNSGLFTHLEAQAQTVLVLLYNGIHLRNKAIETAASLNLQYMKNTAEEKEAFPVYRLLFPIIDKIEDRIKDYMTGAEIFLKINQNRKTAKLRFADFERWYDEMQKKKQNEMEKKTREGSSP
jgi:hypothetical protein